MAHPVVHFEVCGPDAAALQKYYADLFGWSVDAGNPMGYGMVSAEEGGIAGGIAGTEDGAPRVTFYVMTDDLQSTLDSAEQLGGKTVLPPTDVPGGPSIAMFTDPQGNAIGLLKG
jgi:predicted enzyme related to lactoylglutathione lyase